MRPRSDYTAFSRKGLRSAAVGPYNVQPPTEGRVRQGVASTSGLWRRGPVLLPNSVENAADLDPWTTRAQFDELGSLAFFRGTS